MGFLFFLVNLLDTSISVTDYLVAIIPWLCQYYSTRLEYILGVIRIVVISKSSYSVSLELPGNKYYLNF